MKEKKTFALYIENVHCYVMSERTIQCGFGFRHLQVRQQMKIVDRAEIVMVFDVILAKVHSS